MTEGGGLGWGPWALLAAPACCGGAAWLATAGRTTGAIFAWSGLFALAAAAVAATVGLLLWRRRWRVAP